MPTRQQYGNWAVRGKLSRGGQAKTFLVVRADGRDANNYVLKKFHGRKIRRYRNEISACLQLSHPNVTRVVDYNLDSEPYFLVTEHCAKGCLSPQLIRGLSALDRLSLFLSACEGVAHAHSKGIVHRDLKPENLFVRSDMTPVVGDFGICFLGENDRATDLNEWVGPRGFIPPEMEGGRLGDVKPSADVYMLGKILYWLFSDGVLLPRERFKEPRYNLLVANKHTSHFLVYELLDKTVLESPGDRLVNATVLVHETSLLIRRIRMNAHSTRLDAPQHCNYCGAGSYQIVVDTRVDRWHAETTTNKFRSVGHSGLDSDAVDWLVFRCDHCGNIQYFNAPRGNSGWWPRS